jgi:hypothetical protein
MDGGSHFVVFLIISSVVIVASLFAIALISLGVSPKKSEEVEK